MNAGLYIATNSFVYQKHATLPAARKIFFFSKTVSHACPEFVTCKFHSISPLLPVLLAQDRDRLLPKQPYVFVPCHYFLQPGL